MGSCCTPECFFDKFLSLVGAILAEPHQLRTPFPISCPTRRGHKSRLRSEAALQMRTSLSLSHFVVCTIPYDVSRHVGPLAVGAIPGGSTAARFCNAAEECRRTAIIPLV